MDSESIETFLSEARSYAAPLVISTQYIGRLNRDVIAAIFGNVGTLVCMHLGQIDAQIMQRELGDFTAEDLLDLGIGEAIVRVGSAKDSFNVKIPLAPERESHREAVIALSRERYCRPRTKDEAMLRKDSHEERLEAHDTQKSEKTDANSHPKLSSDQWRMMEYLIDHPDETVTAIYRALGFGTSRGKRVRQQLYAQNLIVEVETRLDQGNRLALFLIPTMFGFQAVNKPLLSGRGGTVHRHFQEIVARHAQSLGYESKTEHRLNNGGSVDVHLSKQRIRVAVEIAVHSKPQRKCSNIRKCLDADYTGFWRYF